MNFRKHEFNSMKRLKFYKCVHCFRSLNQPQNIIQNCYEFQVGYILILCTSGKFLLDLSDFQDNHSQYLKVQSYFYNFKELSLFPSKSFIHLSQPFSVFFFFIEILLRFCEMVNSVNIFDIIITASLCSFHTKLELTMESTLKQSISLHSFSFLPSLFIFSKCF